MISENIDKMIMSSVKDGDKITAGVYRLLKNEFLKHNTAKNAKPLDDATEISIIQKMVKQRLESVKAYIDGNRPELAAIEQQEADLLSELLPSIPTEEDIEKYIKANYPNGIENFTDMVADETITTDCEELFNWLTEKNHPVLGMEPLM